MNIQRMLNMAAPTSPHITPPDLAKRCCCECWRGRKLPSAVTYRIAHAICVCATMSAGDSAADGRARTGRAGHAALW